MPDFFVSVASMTRFGTYPVIHMQSNTVIWLMLGPLLQDCIFITRLMIQNAFYFMKDRCRKFISVNTYYFNNE